ncbi:MAG: hypothetical protein EBR30_21150 [Cytophagia bacterium]|nr:hypothetical protein [Cytophagia bacterium]NBW37475.1 hypothetical protein [Cytophagia bacterium]
MKRRTLILLITGTAYLLTSCDPAKLIILKNKTEKPAYFRWTVRTDSTNINGEQPFKTLTLDLGTSKSDKERTIVLGFGNWPTSEIERFVNEDIQSIEIASVNEKIIMTDKTEIKNYLIVRRHGIFKNFISIKLK